MQSGGVRLGPRGGRKRCIIDSRMPSLYVHYRIGCALRVVKYVCSRRRRRRVPSSSLTAVHTDNTSDRPAKLSALLLSTYFLCINCSLLLYYTHYIPTYYTRLKIPDSCDFCFSEKIFNLL